MAQEVKITDALRDTVATHPNVKEVHFTADGHYHFKDPVTITGEDKVSRRYVRTEEVKSQIVTKEGLAANIVTRGVPSCEVVKTLTREDILGDTNS